MYTSPMTKQDAIDTIRELIDYPQWQINQASVRELELKFYEEGLHTSYVAELDAIVSESKDWSTVDGRNFWSIIASLEDRAKALATVARQVLDYKSKSVSN